MTPTLPSFVDKRLKIFLNKIIELAKSESWVPSSEEEPGDFQSQPSWDPLDDCFVQGRGCFMAFDLSNAKVLISLEVLKLNEPHNVHVVVYYDPTNDGSFDEPLFIHAGHSLESLTDDYADALITQISYELSP